MLGFDDMYAAFWPAQLRFLHMYTLLLNTGYYLNSATSVSCPSELVPVSSSSNINMQVALEMG